MLASMTIEERIDILKAKLSRIDTVDLLAAVGSKLIPMGHDGKSVADSANVFKQTDLPSPMREYLYLCGLMLSTDYDETRKIQLSASVFKELERLVNDIAGEYLAIHVKPIVDGSALPEAASRLSVSYAAFSSYFDTGKLNFTEQTTSKVEKLFSQFDPYFLDKLSLTTKDLIDIYKTICILDERTIDDFFGFLSGLQSKANEFESEIIATGMGRDADSESLLRLLGERISADSRFMAKLTDVHTVKKEALLQKFDSEKIEAFLQLFSTRRGRKNFQYYTDDNPLIRKPLVEIEDGKYFVTFQAWLAEAIYDLLNETISRIDSFAGKKGEAVEKMAFDLLQRAFGDKAKYYRNVCEAPKTNEHDLLIVYENYVLIVEIKGSKIRPPAFNPEKSYKAIKDHFSGPSGIGGAYKQAIKLKKLVESSPSVTLYASRKNPFTISASGKKNPPNYPDAGILWESRNKHVKTNRSRRRATISLGVLS